MASELLVVQFEIKLKKRSRWLKIKVVFVWVSVSNSNDKKPKRLPTKTIAAQLSASFDADSHLTSNSVQTVSKLM